MVIVIDGALRVLWASPSVSRVLGYYRDDLVGMNGIELLHPDDVEYAGASLLEAEDHPGFHNAIEIRLLRSDGRYTAAEVVSYNPPGDPDDRMVLSIRPLEARGELPGRRRLLEAAVLSIVSTCSSLAADQMDASLNSIAQRLAEITNADETMLETLSADEREEEGGLVDRWSWHRPGRETLLEPCFSEADLAQVGDPERAGRQTKHTTSNGRVFTVLCEPVRQGRTTIGLLRIAWHGTDVRQHWDVANAPMLEAGARMITMTARRCYRERVLSHRVKHDELTGLGNRVHLTESLRTELAHHQGPDGGLALAFCDLDRFKEINDTSGHAAGDAVLRAIAQRLRASVRDHDLVCRVGGDEFVVVFPHIAERNDALHLGERLVTAFAEPVTVSPTEHYDVGASIGLVVVFGDSLEELEPRDLLGAADAAMYEAKANEQSALRVTEIRINS